MPAAALHRDGEDELYYNMLMEEDPWNKLQVQAVLSAVCLTASTVICWLCEKDPAGESWDGPKAWAALAAIADAAHSLMVQLQTQNCTSSALSVSDAHSGQGSTAEAVDSQRHVGQV
jgi:hypothetical protein